MNNKASIALLIAVIVSSFSGMTIADNKTAIKKTVVIYDRGGVSTRKYIESETSEVVFEKPSPPKGVFPVTTKTLTLGRVEADEAKDINLTVAFRPLFIIGYDSVSINWLKSNKTLLKDKKAIGYVVNIESQEQMEHLLKLTDNEVMMMPKNGDEFAKQLNIKHYPFYVDREGVMR